jgi:hypothetical protein
MLWTKQYLYYNIVNSRFFFFPSQRLLVSLFFSWLSRTLFASRSRARKRKKCAGAHLCSKINFIFLGVGGCAMYDLNIVLYVGFEQSSHHSLVRYFVTVSNGR